ncbi:guanylate kinase [Elongatibacter sediminis]|uniref:Guanylate kinase n=1 Tax=Elongatibacter sediminis TaxID=3119006 RepID=A0AAW9R921_9GAMM
MERSPTLYVVAAPSGGGKTSLIAALLDRDPNLSLSVSFTTRPPRPGEVDGRHYRFIDKEQFMARVRDDAFLEYAEVYGHYYGTGRAAVEHELLAGRDVLLDIDWQGAQQIRTTFAACCSVFILPPSLAELRRRLESRGQDSREVIERRMAKARSEIEHWEEFDFVVINDDFQAALADLHAIIRERRPVRTDQAERIAPLLAELLENE